MNDGGGFNVGHLEPVRRNEVERKRRERDGESEMLLKATVLFLIRRNGFPQTQPKGPY